MALPLANSQVRLPGMVSLGNFQMPELRFGNGASMAPAWDSGADAFKAGMEMGSKAMKPLADAVVDEFDPTRKKKKALEMAMLDAQLEEAQLANKLSKSYLDGDSMVADSSGVKMPQGDYSPDEDAPVDDANAPSKPLAGARVAGGRRGFIPVPAGGGKIKLIPDKALEDERKLNMELAKQQALEGSKSRLEDEKAQKKAWNEFFTPANNKTTGVEKEGKDPLIALQQLEKLNELGDTGWEHRFLVPDKFIGENERRFQQAAQSLISQMEKFPGAMSDADREFMIRQLPRIDLSQESNKPLIETMKRQIMRQKQYLQHMREQRTMGKTLDVANATWKDYSDANPIIAGYNDDAEPIFNDKAVDYNTWKARPAGDSSQPAGAAAPAASEPVKINSDAEFNALPAGSLYVGPDGVKRRK